MHTELTTQAKSLNKQIISLAWPVVLQTLVRSFIPILDSFWLGKLGTEELAAITVGSFLSWGIFALGEMIPIGTNSLVAQSTGAKQTETTRYIATLNLFNAVLLGILIALLVFPLLPFLYKLTNLDSHKSFLANLYLLPLLIGLGSIILFETVNSIFRGNGDTKTPFKLLMIVVSMKLLLTPLLIFGLEGNLKLGMSGASLSTVISYGSVFLIGLFLLKKRELITSLRKKFLSFIKDISYNYRVTKETVKIGIPLSLEGLAFSLIYVFVSRFVSDFGTVGLAALGIGHRSEAIPYHIAEGFSVTATIIVGQNIGAGNPDRAEKSAWRVLVFAWIPMAVYGSILFFFPDQISGVFTNDRQVIETARVYNLLAAFAIFFTVSETVFTGAFAGAGNSIPPLLISLPITALRIPLCAILAPVYGMNGIWIAIFSTVVVKGILLALWFKRGNWKKRKFILSRQSQNPFEFIDLK